jgi:NAD(P)-dependent dehydrogenase (short-subunit alcohol dehydrogenase family)
MKEKSVSTVRRVLVTGANKGIGRELCRRMLSDVPD